MRCFEHFVAQRKAVEGLYQGDADLFAVGPMIVAITASSTYQSAAKCSPLGDSRSRTATILAHGTASSPSAATRLAGTKRRMVQYTVGPPTPIARAISSSPVPASAASRICARFSSRVACSPVAQQRHKLGVFCLARFDSPRNPTAASHDSRASHEASTFLVSHQACQSSSGAATRQVLFDELLAAVCFSALTVRGVVGPCFRGVQAIELVAGSINRTLIGLNIRDGYRLVGRAA